MPDNQYKDAPQSAPLILSENSNIDTIRQDLKEYHSSLVSRVLSHDPYLVAKKNNPAIHLVEEEAGTPYWIKDKVDSQPTSLLRNIDAILSNTEDILKENAKLLM